MIPPALKQLARAVRGAAGGNALDGKVSRLDATPRRLVLRADGLPERQADQRRAGDRAAEVGAATGAAAGFARKQGVDVGRARRRTRRRRASTSRSARRWQGRATRGHSGRGAAGADPGHPLAQDHVLDGQGRAALHPADPLDRGAAGRRGGAVRNCRREVGQRDARAPAAWERRRSRSTIDDLRERLREELRDSLGGRAPAEDREARLRGRGRREAATPACSTRWSTSPNIPTPISGDFDAAVSGAAARKC